MAREDDRQAEPLERPRLQGRSKVDGAWRLCFQTGSLDCGVHGSPRPCAAPILRQSGAVTEVSSHVLAPPFGLPGELDATLLEALRDERWGDAVTLLRDHADQADPAAGRRLLLLAYARFRDADEVMLDERLAASQEALRLIERAGELGVDLAEVAPLRDEVERTLDEESRAELAVLSRLPESGDFAGLPLALLLDAGHRLWSRAPARAAECFAAAARLDEAAPGPGEPSARDARRLANRVREGLCRAAAGQHERARPLLEAALGADWSAAPLRGERHLAEAAATALLSQARGADFTALWNLADALGRAHGLAFPSVWPNQEALLERCVELREWPRARALAERIEASREVLPRRLAARLQQVRLEQV